MFQRTFLMCMVVFHVRAEAAPKRLHCGHLQVLRGVDITVRRAGCICRTAAWPANVGATLLRP